MKLDGFQTYSLFIALKNHFTQEKYDFHKYHGKTRVSKDTFLVNKDRFKYMKLSRNYDETELQDFIIANLLMNRVWIGDLLDDRAEDLYKDYVKRKQAISYYFTNEIEKTFMHDAKKLFEIKNGQLPEILNLYLQGDIGIDTLAILNEFIKFDEKFDKKIGKDDIIWSRARLLVKKLTPFLQYDKDKIRNILKSCINNSLTIKGKELEKT